MSDYYWFLQPEKEPTRFERAIAFGLIGLLLCGTFPEIIGWIKGLAPQPEIIDGR